MRPIPRKRLPHSVTYEEYDTTGERGKTWKTAVTLEYVKIDDTIRTNINNNGTELIGNALMFYDYISSTGLNLKPVEGSKITFEGKTYQIADVDILYGNSINPHHYEVILK